MKLTPNHRMAAFLKEKSIEEILPLQEWLEALYDLLSLKDPDRWGKRLSLYQEEIVWDKIIAQSAAADALLKTEGVARLAREAWVLQGQWKLPLFSFETEESQAFLEWSDAYQLRCEEEGWIDSVLYLNALTDAVLEGEIHLPSSLTLIGFDEIFPQLRSFLQAVEKKGTRVHQQSLLQESESVRTLALGSFREEIKAAALQVQNWLIQKPGALIGIVVPELVQRRAEIARLMKEVLGEVPFNMAAPVPLKSYPLIKAALLILTLIEGFSPFEQWSQLLLSPFIGKGTERQIESTETEIHLRLQGAVAFSISTLIECLRSESALSWVQRLQNLKKSLSVFGWNEGFAAQKKTASQWFLIFTHSLSGFEFASEPLISPEEYQLKLQWQGLLENYQNMELFLGAHSYKEALGYIEKLAQDGAFLPASRPSSVHILGLLEASGIPFDFLWGVGLHREAWPMAPSPNPFIPRALQKTYDLPRSSPDRELRIAQQLTENLCRGGREVLLSYPTVIDERPTTMSPLLASLERLSTETFRLPEIKTEIEKNAEINPYTPCLEEKAPPVRHPEKIRGGTHLLKLQALCPFRAYAEIRLKAVPLEKPSFGLGARERGEMIHGILEYFWAGLSDQVALSRLAATEIDDRIQAGFEKTLNTLRAKRALSLSPSYLSLEKKRTVQLIRDFIELEKRRPYFKVIALELEKAVEFEGLSIRFRVDRVDQVGSETVLIDYKTGRHSLAHWFGERPEAPQLPFYGIQYTPKPTALVLGIVHPEGAQFQGLSEQAQVLPEAKTLADLKLLNTERTWEAQCASWRKILESLVRQFKAGEARVDPLKGESTCRTCTLSSLCRVRS